MSSSWSEGTTIADRYELVEKHSEHLWRARDTRDFRSVALRWEHDEAALNDRYNTLERARMLAGDVVPAVYDRGREGDSWWMAREWIDGPTLDRSLRERSYSSLAGPALANAWFAETLRPVAQSLARLHRAGITHGALWPEHVVLVAQTARLLSVERGLLGPNTETARIEGNPSYLSARQWRGLEKSFSDDVWALGLLASEMLTGRSYWSATSAFALATEVTAGTIDAPSARAKSAGASKPLPKGFDDWFLSCVSRDDSRGYADGDEALDALEVLVLRSSGGGAVPGPCLNIAPQVCLNIAPPHPCLSPIPCLSPVRPPPQPCLKVAPKLPSVITRLREAWDEHREQQAREREEQERARQQNEHRDNPYRGVVLRSGEASANRRRAVYVGVAVSAAVIAWWLAKRC